MRREANATYVSVSVSVCICTYRRPHLTETIRSILAQDCLGRISVEILVCDDDPSGSAKALVEAAAKDSSVDIRYVTSGAANVSVARNTCLTEARGKWIAAIDDDEIAEPHWLSNLIAAQIAHNAEIVKGYVRGQYPPFTPDWVLAGDPYTRDCGPTGTPLKQIGAGNVLFSREFAVAHRIRFDIRFGRSGGEDVDFFARMNSAGARIIASNEAKVYEVVPPERVTRQYIKSRFYRQGKSDGRNISDTQSTTMVLFRVARAIALILLLSAYPVTRLLGGWYYFWCFARFNYARGTLHGLLGSAVIETM